MNPSKAAAAPVSPAALNLQDSFANVAAKAKPAVVNIISEHVESVEAAPYEFFFGDPFEFFFQDSPYDPPRRRAPSRRFERRQQGMGSGVIIDARGYILTNEHVVRDAQSIQVRLPEEGDRVYKGKVVGTDPRSDLAVIRIKAKGDLPYAALGDSDKVRVGDWSIAIGSPFGLEQTVTVGVISAVRQSLNIEGKNYQNMLQTDAAINQGNSGGPLLNIRGEVIGINTAIYAPTGVFSGVGFAIPSGYAREIMEQLIETGRVVRGWLGVEIAPLDDVLAKQFGLKDTEGVLLNRVLPDSPASKAGLKRGDVIRLFDGQKVASPESLQRLVAKTPPEKKVELKVWREGKESTISLVTGKMPESTAEGEAGPSNSSDGAGKEKQSESFDWEGGHFVPNSAAWAKRYDLPEDAPGVVLARLEPGSLVEAVGLTPGDLIASVNREATPDLDRFKKALKKVDFKSGAMFDIYRQGRWFYLSYRKEE